MHSLSSQPFKHERSTGTSLAPSDAQHVGLREPALRHLLADPFRLTPGKCRARGSVVTSARVPMARCGGRVIAVGTRGPSADCYGSVTADVPTRRSAARR